MATRTITRKMKIVPAREVVPEPEVLLVCPHCKRNEKECEEQATNVHNHITDWKPHNWGLSCDDCYYENHPEESDDDGDCSVEEESSEDESSEAESSEAEASEPESEDAECQTEPLPVTAVGVSERRVYGIVDDQIAQMTETFEDRLAEMRRQMMEETERMLAQKLATLSLAKPSKKAEKEKKKQEEEVRGYYEVTNWEEESKRLRAINRELRKESEGKTNTNRKLQEKIDNLESEDPVARYVEEIKKVREVNQVLRKRCEAKDRTYQKMKAMIEALGGKAPAQEE